MLNGQLAQCFKARVCPIFGPLRQRGNFQYVLRPGFAPFLARHGKRAAGKLFLLPVWAEFAHLDNDASD